MSLSSKVSAITKINGLDWTIRRKLAMVAVAMDPSPVRNLQLP